MNTKKHYVKPFIFSLDAEEDIIQTSGLTFTNRQTTQTYDSKTPDITIVKMDSDNGGFGDF